MARFRGKLAIGVGGVLNAPRNAASNRSADSRFENLLSRLASMGVSVKTHEMIPAFAKNPKESRIVGYLLSGYPELELEMCRCLSHMLHGDRIQAIKLMFRLRGEENRIQILDAMVHKRFVEAGLSKEYKIVFESLKRAKEIRNQYAHCHWDNKQKKGILRFIRLEEGARGAETKLKWKEINLPLLEYQRSHFSLTVVALQELLKEFQAREAGKSTSRLSTILPELKPPPLYNDPA